MLRLICILIITSSIFSICYAETIDSDSSFATNDIGTAINEVRFSWPSQVNQEYVILSSIDLTEGFNTSNTLQATPPTNEWWQNTDQQMEFLQVTKNIVTNTPPTPATTSSSILLNGTFENGTTDWSPVFSSPSGASGNAYIDNGELLFDIDTAGNRQHHVFLRQFNLNIINGTNYVVSFDARAASPRTITVFIDNPGSPNNKYWSNNNINIGTSMSTYSYSFTMTQPTDNSARIHIGLGGDINDVWIDNVELKYVISGGDNQNVRAVAHERNRRLHRGNNFMAAKAIQNQGRLKDYELLNEHYFSHCRIGYKMDEKASSTSPYTIPVADMTILRNMVEWCNQMGLIAIIDPVHNWMADDSLDTFDQSTDIPKLSNIWLQVAQEFENDDLDNVFFEIANEPRSNHNAQEIIATGLSAIRSFPGNTTRMVIICGDAFSTRQALIDEFNNDTIPIDDPYLIGTFHYYDPFDFTKQGAADRTPGITWGTDTEFQTVETHFDEVVAANINWANRNNTQPLPIYLGEFGVDNEADNHHSDRKKWLSWVRMQAEKRDFSWAHWNMYQNTDASKGMGPWGWNYYQTQWPNSMYERYFDADPVEALIGRYEFEDGTKGGGVVYTNSHAGFSGSGYAILPEGSTGFGVFAQINNIFIPKNDTYKVKVHYACPSNTTLRIVSRTNNVQTGIVSDQMFPATGGFNSWKSMAIDLGLVAGESNDVRVIALPDSGLQLDWLHITQ